MQKNNSGFMYSNVTVSIQMCKHIEGIPLVAGWLCTHD